MKTLYICEKANMDEETIVKLSRLREETLGNAKSIPEICSVLCMYYPKGTKLIITKDYWRVEEPES